MSQSEYKTLTAWMRKHFMPEYAGEWDSTIHVILKDVENFTVDVKHQKLHISKGLNGDPLAKLESDYGTLKSILRGDLPLDIAIMYDFVRSNNMVETFKFITVFRHVRKCQLRAEQSVCVKATSSVLEDYKDIQQLLPLLSEWCARVASDSEVTEIVKRSTIRASAEIQLESPDILLSITVGGSGLLMSVTKERRGSVSALSMDAGVFYRSLRGAHNMMISLNDREIGVGAPEGFPAEIISLLLNSQAAMSRVFRSLLNEKRVD